MNCYSKISKLIPEYITLEESILKKRLPLGVTGLSYIHKAHSIASLSLNTGKKALVLVPDEAQATRMRQDLESFGLRAYLFPARDYAFRTNESVSRDYEHVRLNVLDKMLSGNYDAIVFSAEASLQLTVPPARLMNNCFSISNGEEYDNQELIDLLLRCGYVHSDQIDGPGQFAVRGGIIDLFPPDTSDPIRVEFFGDTVDSLFTFDITSQRRQELLEEIHITPSKEVLISDEALGALIEKHIENTKIKGSALKLLNDDLDKIRNNIRIISADKYLPIIYPESASIFDYAKDSLLFVCESFSVKEKINACTEINHNLIRSLLQEGTLARGLSDFYLEFHNIEKYYSDRGAIYLDNLPRGSFDTPVKNLITFSARQLAPWNGSFQVLKDDIDSVRNRKDQKTIVLAGTAKAAQFLARDLENEGIPSIFCPVPPAEFPYERVCVLPGSVSYGIEYTGIRFNLFTYRNRVVSNTTKTNKKSSKNAFNSLEELVRGEYVVHIAHGIGIFDGIISLDNFGTIKDYIKIKYDKGDVLYVPVTQLDQVSKYIGQVSENKPVKLNKLGGNEWAKSKNRVRSAVKDMAKELIELYSKRLRIEGHAFSPDIDMQNDFERRFEYVETDDQLKCINEIKKDMEKPYPMDRLLCGDVGFGKTEVALRAVFKCVADGKQCAVLVPTTILALQHYQTIMKRYEGFPVETCMLSRFVTKKEIDNSLLGLKRGSIDIVVGTHRLISKDVQFKDLGLIVIDEEQRFGVAQKERLKSLYPNVDVLTMTATPIPRTLNMAMSGIRDMSVIEEAPLDRLPVQTYVIEFDFGVLVEAMEQELRRGGQVYYLYNNVESITKRASEIKEMIPDARVAIGHGQMSEDELSDVWRKLIEGEIDILVCTTIIETGVDVPNVNTLIIENADRMGLSQLHQIRGRVGRSSRRASAYFTFTRGKQLSEIAERRLDAIREFTEFGSGFHIAMRDLELRGAGDVLGASQHGQMETVGYDLYIKLLEEAINEEKGIEIKKDERECVIDLPIDAHIPDKYITSVPQKLQMYRRIADIRTKEDAMDVLDELIDRFGDPPASVQGLVKISMIRSKAATLDVYEITMNGDVIIFRVSDLDMARIARIALHFSGRLKVSANNGKPYISVRQLKGENKIALIDRFLDYMENEN